MIYLVAIIYLLIGITLRINDKMDELFFILEQELNNLKTDL